MPIVECQRCQKEFKARLSQIKKGEGKFCSYLCAGLAKKDAWAKLRAANAPPDIPCEYCKQPFTPTRDRRRFCSRRCVAIAKAAKTLSQQLEPRSRCAPGSATSSQRETVIEYSNYGLPFGYSEYVRQPDPFLGF